MRGLRGFTATELSCANPGENPGFACAQGADGEKGLAREMRCVRTLTDAASTGAAAAPANASDGAMQNPKPLLRRRWRLG